MNHEWKLASETAETGAIRFEIPSPVKLNTEQIIYHVL